MKQEIRKQALKIIAERKRKAEAQYSEKLSHLFENEKYRDLQKEYSQVMIENAKKASYGEPANQEREHELKQQLEEMQNHEKPQYSCSFCKDEGYKDGQMCICLKREISKILLNNSGFEKLENFEDGIKSSGKLKDVYLLLQKWCQSDFKKNLVYLAGPTGVGKTFLMQCIANELISRGKVVKITTAFALNQDFKTFNKTLSFKENKEDDIINKYIDCEILFIDDLGTEPIYKNITIECLYLVINERKMRELPTIITSNFDIDTLRMRYEDRIYSRIIDHKTSIVLYLDGEDRRRKSN